MDLWDFFLGFQNWKMTNLTSFVVSLDLGLGMFIGG
jgi:hypothetical protein